MLVHFPSSTLSNLPASATIITPLEESKPVNSAPITPACSPSSALSNLLVPAAATNHQWHKEKIASVGMYRQRLCSHMSPITPVRVYNASTPITLAHFPSSALSNLLAPAVVTNHQWHKERIASVGIYGQRLYGHMSLITPTRSPLPS